MFNYIAYSLLLFIIISIIYKISQKYHYKNKESICNSYIKTKLQTSDAYSEMKNGDIIFILNNYNKILKMFIVIIIDDQVCTTILNSENSIISVPLNKILDNIGTIKYNNISNDIKNILEDINKKNASKIVFMKTIFNNIGLPKNLNNNITIPHSGKNICKYRFR